MPACIGPAVLSVGGVDYEVLAPAAAAPGGECPALVAFTAAEAAQLQASAPSPDVLPPPAQLSAAWSASFVLVVGCYVIARQIGAVVNFIPK